MELEINPFKPAFTIVIFIHYKPRIAVAIPTLDEDDVKLVKNLRNYHVLVNQFNGNLYSKTPSSRKIKFVFRDVKLCFNASRELKELSA